MYILATTTFWNFFQRWVMPKNQKNYVFAFISETMGFIQKLMMNTFVSRKILPQIT